MGEVSLRSKPLVSARSEPVASWSMFLATSATLGRRVIGPVTEKWPQEELFTVPDEVIWRLEEMLKQADQWLRNVMASRSEWELPETFELQPRSTQPVRVKVLNDGPALFSFVEEDDVGLEAIED